MAHCKLLSPHPDSPRGLSVSLTVSPSASASPKLLLAHLEIKTSARRCYGAARLGSGRVAVGSGKPVQLVGTQAGRSLLTLLWMLTSLHRCSFPSTPFCLPGAQQSSLTALLCREGLGSALEILRPLWSVLGHQRGPHYLHLSWHLPGSVGHSTDP